MGAADKHQSIQLEHHQLPLYQRQSTAAEAVATKQQSNQSDRCQQQTNDTTTTTTTRIIDSGAAAAAGATEELSPSSSPESIKVVLISGAGTPVGTSLALAFAAINFQQQQHQSKSTINYKLALLDSDGNKLAKVAQLCNNKSYGLALADDDDHHDSCLQEASCHRRSINNNQQFHNGQTLELLIDLANPDSAEREAQRAIELTLKQFGRLDILVNLSSFSSCTTTSTETHKAEAIATASGQPCTSTESSHYTDFVKNYRKIMNTQVDASVFLSLAAFEALKASQGSIVNITNGDLTISCSNYLAGTSMDVAADAKSFPKLSSSSPTTTTITFGLSMAKAALTTFSKSLAHDFAPYVRVNCISLGPIASGIIDDMGLNCAPAGFTYNNNNNNNNNNSITTQNRHYNDAAPAKPAPVETTTTTTTTNYDAKKKLSSSLSLSSTSGDQFDHNHHNARRQRTSSLTNKCRENELAKMIIYLSSRERGAYITGTRVLLGAPESLQQYQ